MGKKMFQGKNKHKKKKYEKKGKKKKQKIGKKLLQRENIITINNTMCEELQCFIHIIYNTYCFKKTNSV